MEAKNQNDKTCETCMHWNSVPGELNKRSGVPVVLTGADDSCWQWEPEKGIHR